MIVFWNLQAQKTELSVNHLNCVYQQHNAMSRDIYLFYETLKVASSSIQNVR